jgi:hypothetical protein
MTVIDTPGGIEEFRRKALGTAIRIEVNTGMKRSSRGRSTLAIINDTFGKSFRTKKDALAFMEGEGYA